MKINKRGRKEMSKRLLLIGIIGIVLISLIYLTIAETTPSREDLQNELNNLTSQLTDNNYGWLVDYNISYPQIEVYENNASRLIATFPEITTAGFYKIFLTGLNDNESLDTFDLLVRNGELKKIRGEILQKKMRIDEIREKLNQEGGNI